MTFPTARLDSLGNIYTGSTPSTSNETFWGGEIPFVTPAELDRPEPILVTPRTLTESGAAQARLLKKNAILVCCIGSLGKVGLAGKNLAANQQINSIEFDERLVFPKYGLYACQLLKPKLTVFAPATTVPIVNKSKFGQLEIPLPPLAEQRRIAAILDQADALRAKRRESLAQLETLKQSIFLDMFGDPSTNPNRFAKITLSDIVNVSGGYAFKSEDFHNDGLPIIRISNLHDGAIDFANLVRIPPEKVGRGRDFGIVPGDILMAMSGATTGKIGVMPVDITERYYQNQRVANFRVVDPLSINSAFLQFFLKSGYYQSAIWALASGAAQPNVSSTQLGSVLVPVPPLSSQTEFARRIEEIKVLANVTTSSNHCLERLFSSLQHRAFRGEL